MCLGLRTSVKSLRLLFRTGAAEERGVELVEAAFVLPILLTLLLGIIWLGRAYMVYETITRAAREGARYAVLPNCATCGNQYDTSSAVRTNYVEPALSAAGLDPTQVQNYSQTTRWLNTGDDPPQCGVAISFSYPTQLAIPFTSLSATSIDISTQVQMREENQPNGGTCP